ncbi:MAG TPA: CAP domain-containing protein [Candidatus Microsaccharimonas sp.]
MKTTQKRSSHKKTTLQTKVRTHLKHTLVPHKGNQYRPHLVRLHGITAVLVLAVFMQLAYGFVSSGRVEVLGRVSNISASDLLADTNTSRAQSSLPNLKVNDTLNNAAFAKAKDMFANNYWAHTSPTGVTPWKWLGDAGYNYDVAGENLAKNYATAQATVDAWMASPTHRANILNTKYQDIGFAVVDGILDGRPTTLVVAYYGAPATAAVEGAKSTTPAVVYAAPVEQGVGNPLTYFGTALQSLTPATLGALAMLTIVGAVAVAAHHYRKKLPVAWRRSWKLHHGMYTLAGTVGLALVIVFATGGGSI